MPRPMLQETSQLRQLPKNVTTILFSGLVFHSEFTMIKGENLKISKHEVPQYPSMPQPVFQSYNQFPVPSPIMYQPRSDLMQVPITMNSGHIPVPGFVF